MTNTTSLTATQIKALTILCFNGVVYAGRNTVRFCDYTVPFPALRALAARGYCVLEDIPGGGTRAVPFRRRPVAA